MFLVHLIFFHGKSARPLEGAAALEKPRERALEHR
jgi:hypothetical protein